MDQQNQTSHQKHTPCDAEKTLASVKQTVEKISDALLGNEFNQNVGLVKKVEQNTSDIESLFECKTEKIDFDIVKKKVDNINLRIAFFTGIGIAIIWILENYILK